MNFKSILFFSEVIYQLFRNVCCYFFSIYNLIRFLKSIIYEKEIEFLCCISIHIINKETFHRFVWETYIKKRNIVLTKRLYVVYEHDCYSRSSIKLKAIIRSIDIGSFPVWWYNKNCLRRCSQFDVFYYDWFRFNKIKSEFQYSMASFVNGLFYEDCCYHHD